jgi:hypothetical protein
MTAPHPHRIHVLERPVMGRWAVLVMVVVGAVLRLRVAGQDLFADELATYWVVTAHGLTGVVETVSTTAEITPPLSFLLSWLTTQIGHSPELVRLPALIAGIASIPLVHAIGTRTVGRPAALVATALTTLSPFMIFYAAEARGYGVLMALVLLSTYALLRALDDTHTHWWWILYATAICAAAYTHYTCIFVLAAQLAWALWTHPHTRRPLLVSTSAAIVLYLPWLPSLKGDLDSPTTEILAQLSPIDATSVRLGLAQWSVGFPAANIGAPLPFAVSGSSLRELPGIPALVLLGASLVLGGLGLVTARSGVREWVGQREGRLVLVALLALATPAGTLLQSAVGTNTFRTRSLAPSWPFLALAIAALVTAARPALRTVAAALAVASFGLAAGTLMGRDFQRPAYGSLAQFADEHPGAVVVNGASFSAGPLTAFDVPDSAPDAPVFRVDVPEQDDTPFTLDERRPDPVDIAERAGAAAGGRPIIVVAYVPATPVVEQLVDHLPEGYELTDSKVVPGLFELQALVFEPR